MPHPGQLHLVAATRIIFKQGKVLILKRAETESVYPGKWRASAGRLVRIDMAGVK